MKRVNVRRLRAHQRKFLQAINESVNQINFSSPSMPDVKVTSTTDIAWANRSFFLHACRLRTVKLKQRKLADQANSLTDFAKVVNHTWSSTASQPINYSLAAFLQTTNLVFEIVSDLRHNQSSNDGRLNSIEQTLSGLQVIAVCTLSFTMKSARSHCLTGASELNSTRSSSAVEWERDNYEL